MWKSQYSNTDVNNTDYSDTVPFLFLIWTVDMMWNDDYNTHMTLLEETVWTIQHNCLLTIIHVIKRVVLVTIVPKRSSKYSLMTVGAFGAFSI